MIEADEFTEHLAMIGIAVRQPADAATLAVYHDVLGPQTEPGEWRAFVRWVLAGARWRWFPKCAEIQDALREFRGHRPLLAEATEAYERVLAAGSYTPEAGTSWSHRAVRKACGDAAAEAFLAAGGSAAFAITLDEPRRRERFVAGYCEAAREDPSAGLLPAAPIPRSLPAAGEPLEPEEASAAVARIAKEAAQRAPGISGVIGDDHGATDAAPRGSGFTRVIP